MLGLLWSVAGTPAAGCPSLVDAAVAGKPGALTALVGRCAPADLVRAAEHAGVPADLSRFVRARRTGGGDIVSWKAHHRVRWEGTCLAQVDEALPQADRLPALACLADASVREEYDPNELSDPDDDRARFLGEHPALGEAFARCTAGGTGHDCLDRLLPRTGGDGGGDPDRAAWIKAREAAHPPAPRQPREMHCRAVLADERTVVVRCDGSLAKSVCNSESTPLQSVLVPVRCASDHSLVVPLSLGDKPSDACVTAARATVLASRGALPAARRRALAACAPQPAGAAPGAAVRDRDLPPAARGLVAAVLRRQHEQGGAVKLPAQSRRIAEGCGFDVFSVAVPAHMIDGDDWRDYRGHPLMRVKAGRHLPAVGGGVDWEAGAPWFAIGNTLRQGSRRVRHTIQKDWLESFRRLDDHQQALDKGLALDRGRGETRRQSCQPLLVDACTGDIAEVCAVTPEDREPPCPGVRLSDGRCEIIRFARLPALDGAD